MNVTELIYWTGILWAVCFVTILFTNYTGLPLVFTSFITIGSVVTAGGVVGAIIRKYKQQPPDDPGATA